MNKLTKLLAFVGFLLSYPSKIYASDVSVDVGLLRYTIDTETKTAELYGSNYYLSDVTIPEYIDYNGYKYPVISIRDNAFNPLKGGSPIRGSLIIGNNVRIIGKSAFKSNGATGLLIIPNSVISIGDEAFDDCDGFTGSLIIPNSVQTIGSRAFYNCDGFDGFLTIGDNVHTIGEQAFDRCPGFIGSLIIPNSVHTIGNCAFRECAGFSGNLIIGNSVTDIGYEAFYDCEGFTSLFLPSSVENIGYWAFDRINWTKIECEAIKPPTLKVGTVVSHSFSLNAKEKAKLYVPAESLNLYKTATEWKDFKYINPIGSEATGIKLDKTSESLNIGESVTLVATVEPDNAVDKSIVWTSSEEEIATVANGVVTGLKVGQTTITATTVNGLTATCEITVNPIQASGVTLNAQDMTLFIGQTDKLTATVEPANTTDATIVWSSDNDEIAMVAEDGTVTAVSVGVANITATCGEVSTTCKVTVKPIVASSITLNAEDMTLFIGQTDKLTAIVEPENATDATIVWSSDNEDVAKVSADGTVTAVSVGVANITATCGEVSATCKVTVNPIQVSSIELSLEDMTLYIGSTATLTAKVYPENATNREIAWSSADPSIVSVDTSGLLSALQIGETIVTASCGDISATCKVRVIAIAPTSIELNIKDMNLFIGQSETLQAVVRPANTTYLSVIWQSDDESVAIVSASGQVTGVKEGVANITATCGDVTAVCKVTVNPIPASNIEIVSGNISLTIGSSSELKAKVSPDNTTHPEVEWVSSDSNIASVSVDGTVVGVNIGTAIITAKCGNVSATCTVTVIPVPAEGIVITPTSVSMLLGETTMLSAVVFPETTTDKKITWSSDNPAIASVSSTGLVTAMSLGTAKITAWNGDVHATCEVTVNPVVATSISLNVKDETIFVASSTQLIPTVSPTNVTDKTICWTSSKPEIATVTDQGIVRGISVGTTTVTATIGSVSATCQINVVHRIPDMDPAVSTSDRDIKTLSGTPVNMAVYSQGGEPGGWSYIWTKNGQTVSESSELNITAKNDTETVIAETYRVKVENEIDKVIIFSEVYDFVVSIYPAIDQSADDKAITIFTGTDSSNKTREGNTITLSASAPKGGNENGWEYVWSGAQGEIGLGESIETVVVMSSGIAMGVEESIYKVQLTNYGPDGDVWGQLNSEAALEVYRRPETPLQLLRKGDGKSHTFVVMMPLNDAQLSKLEYNYVYGWTDSNGNDHILDVTDLRYCIADAGVYDDSSNRFWVYSIWNYRDGSVVSSGRRYLDGSVDESFDGSSFDGNGMTPNMVSHSESAIYTLDGHYVGTKLTNLSPGIYIYKSEKDGVINTQKLIIR